MKILLLIYSIITSCAMQYHTQHFTQGITGKVYLRQGNYMPSPGHEITKGKPISRTIFIYELTQRRQTTGNGTIFSNIKTRLIAKTQSNNNGDYAISLSPGHYSVFVEEDKQLYANSFDGKGNINPIEVKKDSISKMDIIISTHAVY